MSAPSEPRSPFLRFLDAFFQDQNIKWMLGIGILILVGSSLMLVTAHWDDYTPVWKYLILLGYTAGIHGLGQLSYHSLGLRKTGAGLMLLTVLLIPLTFLGLHWVQPAPLTSWSALFGQAGMLVLLGVTATFSLLASRRIFRHFLRGPQPTFVACYSLLAMAGAIVPTLPTSLAPLVALGLWSVFAVGAVKVNRHVFWLTEEHRLPRICGFAPVLLLGAMFVTLFTVTLAPYMPVTWLGFGLVLTAIPVLLTADALAWVYQVRNAAVPRPLPWSLVLPIFLGLVLTVAGVCVAGIGFPETQALTPTAALAAVVLGVTARRTGHRGFVWLMLLAILTAYQTTPAFCRETVQEIIHAGATAVHEPRLPYAFYGLTYLPLLAGLSCVAALLQRRRETLFSTPLRQFAIGLGVLLLGVSLTHGKALFPVGLALTVLFGLQLVIFRDRRLLPAAIAAFLVAGSGAQTFVEQVLLWPHSVELPLLAWVTTAGLLLWPGKVIDRRSMLEADSLSHWQTAPLCRLASVTVLLVTAVNWLARAAVFGHMAIVAGIVCGVLLFVHAWQLASRHLARTAFAFAALLAAAVARDAGWTFAAVMSLESVILGVLWIVGGRAKHVYAMSGDDSPATAAVLPRQVLRHAAADIALCGQTGTTVLYAIPMMSWTVLTGAAFTAWIVALISLCWVIDAAWRRQSAALTVLGWMLAELSLGVLAATVFFWGAASGWYPALATILPLVAIGWLPRHRESFEHWVSTIGAVRVCTVMTLAAVALGSLPVFTAEFRVAGMLSLAGLLWSAAAWQQPALRTAAMSVAGWQCLAGVLQLTSPTLHSLIDFRLPLAPATALPLALMAVLLSLLWNSDWMRARSTAIWPTYHRYSYLVVAFVCVANTTLLHDAGLSAWEAIVAVAVFGLVTAEQLWLAMRRATAEPTTTTHGISSRDLGELHVWLAEEIAVVGAVYLWWMGVLHLGGIVGRFAPVVLAAVLFGVSRAATASRRWNVLSQPFEWTSLLLPLATVGICLWRHVSATAPGWLGLNSLALLLTAAFYFWRGLEQKSSGLLILSAAVLNIASILLWRELEVSDPQFFMIPLGLTVLGLVELLKPQIPSGSVDPLRYVGALTILVSPTFHIVEGSWLHLLTLLIVSVLITLAAIGLRVRALMYAGTAFLVADLVAMVIRGSLDNASLLWIVGIGVGTAVIGLAAYCERHRELMLQRLRMIAARLEAWD